MRCKYACVPWAGPRAWLSPGLCFEDLLASSKVCNDLFYFMSSYSLKNSNVSFFFLSFPLKRLYQLVFFQNKYRFRLLIQQLLMSSWIALLHPWNAVFTGHLLAGSNSSHQAPWQWAMPTSLGQLPDQSLTGLTWPRDSLSSPGPIFSLCKRIGKKKSASVLCSAAGTDK